MHSVEFQVVDVPKPGGSKRGFVVGKRAIIVEDCKKNKTWREAVKAAALAAMGDNCPMDGALELRITFLMPRPKAHFRSGQNAHILKPNAPPWHSSKPDATKLTRSTEDALTGIVWTDDARIARQEIEKRYVMPGERPGAKVWVGRLGVEENF